MFLFKSIFKWVQVWVGVISAIGEICSVLNGILCF